MQHSQFVVYGAVALYLWASALGLLGIHAVFLTWEILLKSKRDDAYSEGHVYCAQHLQTSLRRVHFYHYLSLVVAAFLLGVGMFYLLAGLGV